MIKRLIKVIAILIMIFYMGFIELPYFSVRWLITGKPFGEPMIDKVIDW